MFFLLALYTAGAATYRFDFGTAGTEVGYTAVDNVTLYSSGLGYGWVSTNGLLLRDRGINDNLRRDFIFDNTTTGITFRMSGLTANGKYLMKVLCGDANYGDHIITVSVPGAATLPTLSPRTGEYLQLTTSVTADATGILNITFGSPTPNWAVNALTLESTTNDIASLVETLPYNPWDLSVFATDPTPALLSSFDPASVTNFASTGFTRADYLAFIRSEVDFWKTKQNSSGAIIDPYANTEIQYATPAFANAAAALVVYAGRNDLIAPAALAMDKASLDLHNRTAASSHEDFYPAMLAHALRLLTPYVDASRVASWKANLIYDPYATYRQAMGSMNWNIVSSCGEAQLHLMGIRPSTNFYVTESWAAQGVHFMSPYGMYEEGPMAYDHFPRIWLEDALAQGYTDAFSTNMSVAVDRAAITSLFMQSPWGELPAGGRSAHHQWGEAEQCVTYEIYAAKAKTAGNTNFAGVYKRAAHLAFSSMKRWVRPSGEMQVVKNWVDPSSRFAYETYSYHSQYNLLPMAMLSMAYEYASPSEDVAEAPAPADAGGYMFKLDNLHKVFANAGGTYVELDTAGDHHYDATGLIRVHQKGVPPQIGPSDSLLAGAAYNSPDPSPITTGVGVSWKDGTGAWRTLGEMTNISSVTVTPVSQAATGVVFSVTYAGNLPNAASVTESYRVTPNGVQLTTELSGYSGPLRYVWPVLATDGKTTSSIGVDGNTVSVSQGGAAATFTAIGAQSVSVAGTNYSNHNGWARLATAEFPSGGAITLSISRALPDVSVLSASPVGDTYNTTPTLQVVMKDNQVVVDPNQVVLLVDGSPVTPINISKIATTTTVSYASSAFAYGMHTAGVIAGPGTQTNSWTFNIVPLPPFVGNIYYVDATSGVGGNTALAAGGVFSPLLNTTNGFNSNWEQRTPIASSGTIIEAGGQAVSVGQNAPRLVTTITNLVPGANYKVYVYFWSKAASSATEQWLLRAGLTNSAGELTLYGTSGSALMGVTSTAASLVASTNGFAVPPTTNSESGRLMYQADLGQMVANGSGVIPIFVDDYSPNTTVNNRSWYDGVGYAQISAPHATNVTASVNGNQLACSWPADHLGWILQAQTNGLGTGISTNWVDIAGSGSIIGTNINIDPAAPAIFFRLRSP